MHLNTPQRCVATPINLLLISSDTTQNCRSCQLALQSRVFKWLACEFSASDANSPSMLAIADLLIIAFFFLFQVGKIIRDSPGKQRKKRTMPLRKKMFNCGTEKQMSLCTAILRFSIQQIKLLFCCKIKRMPNRDNSLLIMQLETTSPVQ